MKTKLIAALTALTVVTIANPVKAYTTAENSFIDAVAIGLNAVGLRSYSEVLFSSSSAQTSTVSAGYAACDAMQYGLTPEDLYQSSLNRGVSQNQSLLALSTAIAAALNLCPEYSWMVETETTASNEYYAPSSSQGQWATLTASDRNSQINVRSTPSLSASSPHYGLVGDAVWVTRIERHSGYDWYFVGFPNSGATGWVRGDFVSFD